VGSSPVILCLERYFFFEAGDLDAAVCRRRSIGTWPGRRFCEE
jgi:hypothetical protein